MDIRSIAEKLSANRFELSVHAEREKQDDMITFREIDAAFENFEIVEDYPDDPRGHSCLLLGFTRQGKPLHFVCGNLDEEKALIVTMYRPDPEKWLNFRVRRKR